jgi:hypothetical protein
LGFFHIFHIISHFNLPFYHVFYQVRLITVFTIFRLLTDFVCLYTYEFWLSLCKIVRSSVILLLPLFHIFHMFSLFNLPFFHIVHILSLFNLCFFHNFSVVDWFCLFI